MNPEKIQYREFTIADYEALISLWKKAKLPYRPKGRDSRKKIRQEMKFGHSIFLLAEKDSQIIGSIFGTHDGRKGWINRLAVAPECQRHGIGKKLVSIVEEKLNKMGIEIIACLIEDWNKTSITAFRKMGFKGFADIMYFTKRKHPDI